MLWSKKKALTDVATVIRKKKREESISYPSTFMLRLLSQSLKLILKYIRIFFKYVPVKFGFMILPIIGVLRITEEFYLCKDKDKYLFYSLFYLYFQIK